jgi:4-hydroxy-3-methylbut-2-enyl diphosphate reductase
VRDPEKVAWLSQTTLSVDETLETVAAMRERFPRAARPAERRHLLRHPEPPARGQGDRPDADLVIVVGSRNSSNSVRLVEVALEAGAKARTASTTLRDRRGLARRRVDRRRDERRERARDRWSTACWPSSERGYPDAQAVHSAEESLIFALPPELRRDLRAARRPRV